MQTFLPYADFGRSMQVLDQARLGKQRVETLQVLRSLLLPSYGWQNHPVSRMWRGFLPALTAYGLANVDEWTARGYADSTRALILEFAPQVEGMPQADLAGRHLLPPWIGDDEVHRSHRSNLIRKNAEYYSPLFPGDSGDLDYVWPRARDTPARAVSPGRPIRIIRAQSPAELQRWREHGVVAVGELSPRGRDTPAWRAQVSDFATGIITGDEVGVLVGNDESIHRAEVSGDISSAITDDGEAQLVRRAEFIGRWSRRDFAVPATLQDPRSVFSSRLSD